MVREQRWPDAPRGFHAPQNQKPALDTCLPCCLVVLIAGVIGFLILVLWNLLSHIVIPS